MPGLLGPCLPSLHIGRQLIRDSKREGLIDIRQVPASGAGRPRQTHQDPISLMAVARAPLCAAAAFIKARASIFFPPSSIVRLVSSSRPSLRVCLLCSCSRWMRAGWRRHTHSGERKDKKRRKCGADKATTKLLCSFVGRSRGKWGCMWTTWCDIRNLAGMQIHRRSVPHAHTHSGGEQVLCVCVFYQDWEVANKSPSSFFVTFIRITICLFLMPRI